MLLARAKIRATNAAPITFSRMATALQVTTVEADTMATILPTLGSAQLAHHLVYQGRTKPLRAPAQTIESAQTAGPTAQNALA